MKLRILTIALLAIFALGIGAVAKDRPLRPSGQAGIRQNAACGKALGLNDEQKAKIKTILQQFRADVRDTVKSNLTKEEKKTKVQNLREQAKADILAALTPDQQAKAQQSGIIDKMLRPHGRAMKMMQAFKQLNLTDQQKAAIKDIFAKSREQAKAIKSDTTLDQAAKKAKFAELRKATMEQVQQLLTPEQKAQLQNLHKNRPAQMK